jgi:hypothetical protein
VERALVAESPRIPFAQATVAGDASGTELRSLSRAPESNPLDTPPVDWCEAQSSIEPDTEQALGGHWFPFILCAIQSRFVGIPLPSEQTIGMVGITDHRIRRFGATAGHQAQRLHSLDRIKDENQEKWLVTRTNRRDALTTDVQFAKSLLSVIDTEAALEPTDALNTSERERREETVNGTLLTPRNAFAVTHLLRPIVRLFRLAPNAEKSLMCSCRSSEVASSTSRVGATDSARCARVYCKRRRLHRSSTINAGFERASCRNATPKYSAGHPFPSACPHARRFSLRRGTYAEPLARGWERTRERISCMKFLPDDVQGLCIADVSRTKVVEANKAWRDSLQEHGARTVSSYSRWSPPDRRGRSS